MLADNVQNAAANVVVQYVQISYGPWLENSEGGLEVQADLYPNASGTAVDLPQRDGHPRPPGTAPPSGRPRSSSTRSACRSRCSRARPGSSWCRTPSSRRRRRSGPRHRSRTQRAGLRATTASSRQSSAAANTPGCALASASSNTPAAAPRRIRLRPLHSVTSKPARFELGHQLARAVLDLVVVVHRLVRAQPPHRPVGRVEAEPPARGEHAERLARHRVAVGLR